MNQPISILIVDDHAVVRHGVAAFLSTQADLLVVAEAGSGAEAVKLAREFAPDVVLLDLIMPKVGGV